MNRFGLADEERGPVGVFEGYSENLLPDMPEDDGDEDWQESSSHWDDEFVDSDNEDDFDGQPDERQEWHDFDPDC
jgi:hypothetical protein